MQDRDRIITFLGAGGVIIALLLLSRCQSDDPAPGTESVLRSTSPTGERALPLGAGTNRPGAYTGPSLDQLIQDGARNRGERFGAGGSTSSGISEFDARAMFEGEQVPPRVQGPGSPGSEAPRRFETRTRQAVPANPTNANATFSTPTGSISPFPSQAPTPSTFTPPGDSVAARAPAVDTQGNPTPTTTPEGAPAAGAASGGTGSNGTGPTPGGTSGTGPFVIGGIDLSDFFPDGNFPPVGGGDGGSGGNGGTGGNTGGGTTANRNPVIASINVSPAIIAPPGPITITATGVSDPDSTLTGEARNTVARVQFFRDSDANNQLDPAVDQLLGTDSDVSDGFGGLYTAQPEWRAGGGPVRLFARVQDERGAFSPVVSTLVTLNRVPTVASLGAVPAFVNPGGSVTLTASGVSDPDPPGAALSTVEFYLDTDADGDIGNADVRLGAASSLTSPTLIVAVGPETSAPLRYLVRARDQLGAVSAAAGVTVRINRAPGGGSLSVTPASVTPPGVVTLQASGFADPDSGVGGPGIASIEFFRDVDGDGAVSSPDLLLGTVNTATGSASLVVPVPPEQGGAPSRAFLARAADAQSLRGPAASASVSLNRAPVISALTASDAPRVLAPLTLTAQAADPDPPPDGVASVSFYVDTNADGLLDEAFDELLGVDASSAGGFSVTVEARASWVPSRRFFARAADSAGARSAIVPLDATVGPFPDSVLRVRSGSPAGGDGLTWAGAFDTIDRALSTALRTGGVVTEVWVAAGTYPGTLTITQPIALLGGFAGVGETSATQRDWAANPTVIDAGGKVRAIDVASIPAFTLDGFVVRNGAAPSGAGLRSAAVNTVIAHWIFRDNEAVGDGAPGGGAVHLLNAGAGTQIINCLFHQNTAPPGGAGAAVLVSAAMPGALVANCTLAFNTGNGTAALHADSGSLSIVNTIIAMNSAGGLSAGSASGPIVSNCNLFGNTGFDTRGPASPVAPVSGDPMFSNPAGGDFTLGAGSPCVDAGSLTQPPTEYTLDLAHRPRRVDADAEGGPAPDVGAFERSCAPPPCRGDLNGDGSINTADLTAFLAQFGLDPLKNPAADLNEDGAVNTLDLVIFLGRFSASCPICTPP